MGMGGLRAVCLATRGTDRAGSNAANTDKTSLRTRARVRGWVLTTQCQNIIFEISILVFVRDYIYICFYRNIFKNFNIVVLRFAHI